MKVKLSLREAVSVYDVLTKVRLQNVKVNYIIAKIINQLEPDVLAIRKSVEPSKEFKEFTQLYNLAISKLKGNESVQEVSKLMDKYKQVIQNREIQIKDLEQLLDEKTIIINTESIRLKELPENVDTQTFVVLDKCKVIIKEGDRK